MDREKLIEKIQSTDKGLDERDIGIKLESYNIAIYIGWLILAIIMVIRSFSGTDFVADLMMVVIGQAGMMSVFYYRRGRNKKMNLAFSVVSGILFLAFLYQTLVYYGIFG